MSYSTLKRNLLIRRAHIQQISGKHNDKSIKETDEWMQTSPSSDVVEQRKQRQTKSRKSLLAELKVCRNLQNGKEIHAEAINGGNDSFIYVATALINMYARCRSMGDAHQVFDRIKHPDVVAWNALILGYAENREGVTALDLFEKMRSRGCAPDSKTFIAAFKACTAFALDSGVNGRAQCRDRGKQLHSEVGCHSDTYVQNTIVDMYTKCGSMVDARLVFDAIKRPDVVSWTTLILGYAENGEGVTALDLFERMKCEGCAPNSVTFVAALKACTSLALAQNGNRRAEFRQRGKQIHSEVGCHMNAYVLNTLIDMYGKCGSMVDARQVFDIIKHPDSVSWAALILGYAENGEGGTALDLFARMKSQGCAPTSTIFVAALKACISLTRTQGESGIAECRERGKQIHLEIGSHLNSYVQSMLVDMYGKCGSMVDGRRVFDSIKHPSVVSWTALILGYADNGLGIMALDLFARMKSQGYVPNSVTFVAALKACTSLAQNGSRVECREKGKVIHLEVGCHLNTYVQNTLIDMYSKCGSMVEAREVFDSMEHPDVVSFSALILGYAENGEGVTALDLFARMKSQSCTPNSVTYAAVLKACGLLGALESGSKIHAEIATGPLYDSTILITCLVDFYAKCGSLMEAQKVFDSHARARNLKTWTALLAGYSRLGDTKAVFELFEGMQDAGFRPDSVTFLCILTCCSHAGLLGKANQFFEAMSTNYDITPTSEHYSCMIDILGRSNKLDDAVALLQSMPCKPGPTTWMTVLGACRKWKNVEIGRLAFDSLVGFDDTNAAAYVLMAQIYRSRGMWEEQEMVLKLKEKFKAWIEPGQSCWTNEMGQVHTFLVGETRHPQIFEIQEKLKNLGYVTDLLTQKEAICGHTEKLALACALINTEPGKSIRIVKNIRLCNDCHTATALISKLESRTIICRDASRLHIFEDGSCSCGDFWEEGSG